MAKQSYAAALVEALHDSLVDDDRVSLIGSYVLGLGPQRHLMDPLRQKFRDRIDDPPTSEAGAAAVGLFFLHAPHVARPECRVPGSRSMEALESVTSPPPRRCSLSRPPGRIKGHCLVRDSDAPRGSRAAFANFDGVRCPRRRAENAVEGNR